jgi:acyl-CoA thioesterase
MIPMHIDNLFEQVKHQILQNRTNIEITVPQNWAQGRTLYGGISASLVYQAIRQQVAIDQHLRALNTSFIGPIEPEKPFSINIELLREGKNTTVVKGEIYQNNKIALTTLATFGMARESQIHIDNAVNHAMEKPNEISIAEESPTTTPSFIGHFEIVKLSGDWPFTKSKQSALNGWMRFKQPPLTFTDAHLVALIDMWPPTVLQMLDLPAPASTMSWNLEFIHPHNEFKNNEWFAYHATTRQASSGYAHTEANVWDEKGDLVAISRQTVAIFA